MVSLKCPHCHGEVRLLTETNAFGAWWFAEGRDCPACGAEWAALLTANRGKLPAGYVRDRAPRLMRRGPDPEIAEIRRTRDRLESVMDWIDRQRGRTVLR